MTFNALSMKIFGSTTTTKAYDMNDIRTNWYINEVLNSTNKLVNIEINDVRDLFQGGEELHTFDVSVPADIENRMQQLMEHIKKCSKCHEPYNRVLVCFFFPEERPLLMEELKTFCEWIETVPGEFMIKWGMAIHPTPMIRAIMILQ